MIRGLYSAGSGMLVNQRKSEHVEKNIENIQSPGYQEMREKLKPFPQVLAKKIEAPGGKTTIGTLENGVQAEQVYYNNLPGLLRQTENPTDLALNGKGYFVIQTLGGERYTRNGHFVLDPAGYLRTGGGNPVLGENGPIGPLTENFQVRQDGSIVNGDNQNFMGRLRIVELASDQMEREGDTSLYQAMTNPEPLNGEDVQVVQGFVEESNVSLSGQMVKMIEVARSYQSNQKVIQIIDNLLQKTVNEVGRV